MPEIPSGSSVEIKAEDGTKYILTHRGVLYSCTCSEWKLQRIPGVRRTCTHLRQYRGAEEEEKRIDERKKRRNESVLAVQKDANTTPQQGNDLDSTDCPSELPLKYHMRKIQEDQPWLASKNQAHNQGPCVDGEEDDYAQEEPAADCMWSVIIKYDSDINTALQEARQREFKDPAWSKYASIDAAFASGDEKGTGTILDIRTVGEKSGPFITSPLPQDVVMAMFGTSKPTRKMIGNKTLSGISEMLVEKWDFSDRMSVFQSFYIVLYQERSMEGNKLYVPSEILFGGWSDWG